MLRRRVHMESVVKATEQASVQFFVVVCVEIRAVSQLHCGKCSTACMCLCSRNVETVNEQIEVTPPTSIICY